MDIVGSRFSSLSKNEQAYITTTMFGTFQRNRGLTLLTNYQDSLKNYKNALNSAGAAEQKFGIYQESTAATMDKAKASIEGFWQNAISSDTIKLVISGFSSLIDILDILINNSFSSFIIQTTLVSTVLYGLYSGVKLLAGTQGIATLIILMEALTASTVSFQITLGLLTATMLASPLFWIVAGTTAIFAITKAVDLLTTSLSEQKQIVQTLSSDLKGLQSEYDKLYANNNRTAQEEKTLKVLQAQINAKKELLALNTKDIVQKEYTNPTHTVYGQGVVVEGKSEKAKGIDTNIQTINTSTDALAKLDNQYLKLSETERSSAKEQENYKNKKDSLNKSIAESTSNLGDEYKEIQKNIKTLKDAGEQGSEEYKILTDLSDSIEKVINNTNNKTNETNKSTEASKNNTTALTAQKTALSDLATTYKESSSKIKELQGFLDELNDKGLTSDSISKILSDYPEYIDLLDDEIGLREKLTKGVEDYQNKIYDAFVATKATSTEFFTAVKNDNYDFFSGLADKYKTDLANWTTLEKAKEIMTLGVIKNLGKNWEKYFSAFNAGNVYSTSDALKNAVTPNRSKGVSNVVNNTTYKTFEELAQIDEYSRKQAANFKNFNVSSSSGSGGSSSSSKEAYASDQYAISIAKLDSQLKSLEYTKSKLSTTSDEYRNVLQQEIDINKQKQQLTHEEAERLRGLRSQVSQGTKEYDDYTKSISGLGDTWIDLQDKIDVNTFEKVTSKLSEYDKQLTLITEDIATYTSQLDLLTPGSALYDAKLQQITNSTQEQNKILKEKQALIQQELKNDKLSILQKEELATKLKEVTKVQIDNLNSYRDLLIKIAETQIDKELAIFKTASDVKIESIQKQIDALNEENDALEEQKQLESDLLDIADAQKDLADAKTKLTNVQNEKNTRVFQNGIWSYHADPQAVKNAQDNVNSANDKLLDAKQNYYDRLAEIQNKAELKALQDQIDSEKKKQEEAEKAATIKKELLKQTGNESNVLLAEILATSDITLTNGMKTLLETTTLYSSQMKAELQSLIDKQAEAGLQATPTTNKTSDSSVITSVKKALVTGTWATGGYIPEDQIAQIHKGEYVLNPNVVSTLGGKSGVEAMISNLNIPKVLTANSIVRNNNSNTSVDKGVNINNLNLSNVYDVDGFMRNMKALAR